MTLSLPVLVVSDRHSVRFGSKTLGQLTLNWPLDRYIVVMTFSRTDYSRVVDRPLVKQSYLSIYISFLWSYDIVFTFDDPRLLPLVKYSEHPL